MKKILLSFLLFFIFTPFSFAQVVKTPFDSEGVYYSSTGTGFFIDYTRNPTSIYPYQDFIIYDNLGNIIESRPDNYFNDDVFNIYTLDNDIIRLAYGKYTYNYTPKVQIGALDVKNSDILYNNHRSLSSRYCRSRFRVASLGGKFIMRDERVYTNYSGCSPGFQNEYEFPLFSSGNNENLYYSGSITDYPDSYLNLDDVDNKKIQIIGNNWLLYKRKDTENQFFQFVCNDFNVCTESSFLTLGAPPSGYTIRQWNHFYKEHNGQYFGGLSLYYWNDSLSNGQLQTLYYEFDSQGNIIGTSDTTTPEWISRVYIDGNDIKAYKVSYPNLSSIGVDSADFGDYTPLISFLPDGQGNMNFRYVASGALNDFGGYVDDGNYLISPNSNSIPTSSGGSDTSTIVPTDEWSFTTSGYTFLENGFILNNFVPNPNGGELYFEIVAPAYRKSNGDVVYESKEFLAGPYDNLSGYGFDYQTKVTTFFHEVAGEYKVRVKYCYSGQCIYPFGEDYNFYTITLPEFANSQTYIDVDWDYASCSEINDTGTWYGGISAFFVCAGQSIGQFFGNMLEFVKKISDLFNSLGNIGNTDEQKLLDQAFNWVVPGANAQTYQYKEEEDVLKIISSGSFSSIPLLNNIYNLVKYTIMGGLLFWIFIVLFPHKNDNA